MKTMGIKGFLLLWCWNFYFVRNYTLKDFIKSSRIWKITPKIYVGSSYEDR